MATLRTDLPQGTLDLLVLQVAATGPIHGYGIAQRIKQVSRDVLQVPQGSLYRRSTGWRGGDCCRGSEAVQHRPRREVLSPDAQGARAVAGGDRELGPAGRGRRADSGNRGRRRAVSWWRRPRLRDRADDELDAELRDHVERQVADHIRAGMSAREARRRARLEFGGLDHVKEMCRDVRRTRWIEDLGRAPEERLVAGWKTSRTDPTRFIELSYPEFLAWRAQSTSFDNLAALPTTVYGYGYVLTAAAIRSPSRARGSRASSSTCSGYGRCSAAPSRRRDDREGAQPTVVLTHAFWTNVLGADPDVIGSGLTLTGVDFTVIGVLPAGFVFPRGVDVFTALGTRPGLANNRTVFLQVIGRLHPGVSRPQAAAELDGIVSRLEAQRPGAITGEQAALTPLRDHILGNGQVVAALLFAGAVVLLLVAGVNLSGLQATRAARRGGEVALRLGLGASTRHLLRQFVAEGLVLAATGTIVGIGLAVAILDAMIALAPEGIPRIPSATIGGWSLLFAGACLVLVTVGIGCIPLMLVRNPSIDALLRGNTAAGGGSGAPRVSAERCSPSRWPERWRC